MSVSPAQLDSFIKSKHKRRGLFGRDLRTDPCPKCKEGEMHYHLFASSHYFACDRCPNVDWTR